MDEIKVKLLKRERLAERQYIILTFLQAVRRNDDYIYIPSKSFLNAIIEIKLIIIEDHNFVITKAGIETLYNLETEFMAQKQFYRK